MAEGRGLNRRHFLRKTGETALGVSLTALSSSGAAFRGERLPEGRLVEVGRPGCLMPYREIGEPFELAAKRLVFTTYEFIRPARFGWYDDQGNDVSVKGTAGLWDAHFKLFDVPVGIRIVAQPAERLSQPYTVRPVKPWEQDGIELENLVFDEDDGYYKSWGTCRSKGMSYSCFFRSKDFEIWERPELGVVDFEGSRKNNLIETDGPLGNIFKDPSSAEENWKWIAEGRTTPREFDEYRAKRPRDWDPKADRGDFIVAVRGGVSADGFRWKTIPEPLVIEHSDTIVTAYFDKRLGKYVGYFRRWTMPPYPSRTPGEARKLNWTAGRRSIGRAETEDFRRFPLSELIMEPGPDILGPSDTLYTNGHTLVPGAPDQHLFFPTVYHQLRDNTSVAVASSVDGKILHWLPGNPILTTASFGEWDGGAIFARGHLMELPDGRWVLPYLGSNVPHKYPRKGAIKLGLGFATWRKGRLIALEAAERGQFTTFAFMPPGRRMRINTLTARGGNVLVEVTDFARKVLPGRSFNDCTPVIGDHYRTPVSWKGSEDLGVLENTPICFRFKLDQAKLFFVDFE